MNKYRVLQIAIPDLAIVYGGGRGRTLSSSHLAHARNALALAGISQVIDLRQDYTSDRYRDICEANGMKYFHYPVHRSKETVANMVKDFTTFCEMIDRGDFFISCAQGLHRTDIALCTYWVFHGADRGKEPPVLVGYLEEKGRDANKIFEVLNSFYKQLSEQNGQEPMTMEVFKERKSIIRAMSRNMAEVRPARNLVRLMYLYVEFEIDDNEFENEFGRLRDEWAAIGREMPAWLQKLSKQYDHLMQIKQNGPEYDDGIEYGYDSFSTEFRYDIMKTIHLLRTNREYADIIVNDYGKFVK